mmetsp:Transcript_13968/g.36077  ORF Transcript_13968/g.36077 Transcript_13968/m.36077 type:complete len:157 (-) Transcript_13968:86-556(-)
MTQQFVRGLISSPVFVGIECAPPEPRAIYDTDDDDNIEDDRGGSDGDDGSLRGGRGDGGKGEGQRSDTLSTDDAESVADTMVVQLLGKSSAHYYPVAMRTRLAACHLTSLKDLDAFADTGNEDSLMTRGEMWLCFSGLGAAMVVLFLALFFEEMSI